MSSRNSSIPGGEGGSLSIQPASASSREALPPIAADEGQPRVEVHALDEFGADVPDASILLIEGLSFRELGRTDEAGVLRLPASALEGDEVAALSPGFATATVGLGDERPGRIDLVLRVGFSVAGVVVTEDGIPVGPGVRVLLWSQEDADRQLDVLRACKGDPTAWTDVTDASGAFAISGLTVLERYSAIAGGAGYMTPNIVRRIDANSPNVQIVVERAYATWVRFREADGRPIRTAATLYGRNYGTPRFKGEGIHGVGSTSPSVALLGLTEADFERQSFTDRLFLFSVSGTAEAIGPVRLALSYPGYRAVDASFMVPAITLPVPETIVQFEPLSADWSELRVELTGIPELQAALTEVEPMGTLSVTDAAGKLFQFAVRRPSEPQVIPLPSGSYTLSFQTLSGAWQFPSDPDKDGIAVDLGSEPTRVQLDLSALGALRVDISRDDGRPLVGTASIACVTEGGRTLPVRVFARAPYVLTGLPRGRYAVYLEQPRLGARTTESAQARAVTVDVLPGRLIQVELHVPN